VDAWKIRALTFTRLAPPSPGVGDGSDGHATFDRDDHAAGHQVRRRNSAPTFKEQSANGLLDVGPGERDFGSARRAS
jgi:hypothetical protein